MWVRGGSFGQIADQEALLLQDRGCNSVGRPCGKCLRASVKAEHIHLSLRPCGGGRCHRSNREKRKKRERESREDGQGEERSPFGKAPCHFPSWPLPLTSSYLSSIYNLFSVRSGWPDPTHVPAAHFLSALFSLPLVSTSSAFLYFSGSLLSRLSHFSAIIAFFFCLSQFQEIVESDTWILSY